MYINPNKCPACKSNRNVVISASECEMFIHGMYGKHLRGCVDCGVVFIPEDDLKRIQESFDKEK